MNETPAAIHGHMIEQPADGALAAPRSAILDLFGLLGDMNVNRTSAGESEDSLEFIGCDGAQRMRRDADQTTFACANHTPRGLKELAELINAIDEAPLPLIGWPPTEPGMGVEHRQ